MGVYRYKEFLPQVADDCLLVEGAVIIGNVSIGSRVSLWFNSVVRGDVDRIEIGDESNIQDLSILHVSRGYPLKIGRQVTVGHSVTLHGCTIEDNCLIGMGATILDGASIGKNSLVAAGAMVTPDSSFPAGSLIMGSPAKLVRPLTSQEIEKYSIQYQNYLSKVDDYSDESLFERLEEAHKG
jgi:carbonic anhydrase/acetyltransferase-like protein (isoleucine patch superfamily)